MFIANFNRFFAKHGKKTYVALGIVISAMFVIFVTPGRSDMGCGNTDKFGEIYGKALYASKMPVEIKKAMVAFWLDQPQYFGYEINDDAQMIDYMLFNIRRQHLVEAHEIPVPTADRVFELIKSIEIFKDENGNFSKEKYNNMLAIIESRFGIDGATFDQMAADAIRRADLEVKLTEDVVLSDDMLNSAFTNYSVKCARIPLDSKDSLPSDEEITTYFNTNKANIKMPDSRNATIAVFKISALIEQIKNGTAPDDLKASANVSDEVLNKEFEAQKDSHPAYKGKEFTEVRGIVLNNHIRDVAAASQRKAANNLISAFDNKVFGEDIVATNKRFKAEAKKSGADIYESGMQISGSFKIANLPEKLQTIISAEIQKLQNVGDSSRAITADDYVAVIILTDLAATPVPEALTAENQGIIRDIILKERALAYFDTALKAPFENAMAEANKILADKELSQNEKQSRIYALDETLPQLELSYFFIPAKRDYAYIVVPNEQVGGEDKANDIAVNIANQLSDTFWNTTESGDAFDGVKDLNNMASCFNLATANVITGQSTTDIYSTNAEIAAAVNNATMKNPVSGAIKGKDCYYVACLLKITESTLSDPKVDQTAMTTLLGLYRKNVEMQAASVKASEATAAITAKLAAGEELSDIKDYEFTDLPAFMRADVVANPTLVSNFMAKANLMDYSILDELNQAPVNSMLPPRPALAAQGRLQMGYSMFYLASREVAIDKADAETVELFKNNMLNEKKQQILNGIYAGEAERSNTILDPRFLNKK